jgi:hypothetical protein
MNTCTQHEVDLVSLLFCVSPPWSHVLSLPLVDTCTYQAKAKDYNSPFKHAMNARNAKMQKLQEYSNQSEKML